MAVLSGRVELASRQFDCRLGSALRSLVLALFLSGGFGRSMTARAGIFGADGFSRLDDPSLLRCISSGDRQALEELHYRHGAGIKRFLSQLCGDHQLVEDAYQEALVAVWRSAGSYSGKSTVRAWMLGVAKRQASMLTRRKKLDDGDTDALDQISTTVGDPEALTIASASREQISLAVSKLPEGQRAVVLLVLVEGLSYQNGADILGVPVGTVRSRLNHARRFLQQVLGPDGFGRPPEQ